MENYSVRVYFKGDHDKVRTYQIVASRAVQAEEMAIQNAKDEMGRKYQFDAFAEFVSTVPEAK
jgi:hypothetical protein